MTEIPYSDIHLQLRGVVRALNALGATTTGSCWQMVNYKEYGLLQPEGEPDEYESWYVEFTVPKDADGWRILADITWRALDADVTIFALLNAADSGGVVFHMHSGDDTDMADLERRLA